MDEELLDLAVREALHAFGKSEDDFSRIKQKVIESLNRPAPTKIIMPSFELVKNQTVEEIRKIRESDEYIENQMIAFAVFDYQELLGFKVEFVIEAISYIHDS